MTFAMPPSAEPGYWPLAAGANSAGQQQQQQQQQGVGQPQPRRNPTLGPDGAAASAGRWAGAAGAAATNRGGARPAPNPPFWYSFSYGPVHFTVLSTEHDAAPGSEQHAWLEEDLMRVDRCRTPWLVVSGGAECAQSMR